MVTSETPLPCDHHASGKPSSPGPLDEDEKHIIYGEIPLPGDHAYAKLLSQMEQSPWRRSCLCGEMRRPRPINLFEAQRPPWFLKLGRPPMLTFFPGYVPPLRPPTSVSAKRKDLSTESVANDSSIPQLKDEDIKNILAGVYDAEGALERAFWSRLKKKKTEGETSAPEK